MSNCPRCGAPAAPSWAYCPRCATQLTDSAGSTLPQGDAVAVTHDTTPDVPERKRASPPRRRRTGVVLSLLIVGVLVVVVMATDVGAHNQLRTTRRELTRTERQLAASRSQVKGLMSQYDDSQSLVAQALSQIGFLRSFFLETQSEITVSLPVVQGTGGILLISLLPRSQSNSSSGVVATVLSGALVGDAYGIAAGPCPENLFTQSFLATSAQTFEGGTLVFPTIGIDLPNNGARFWFRLHQVAPISDNSAGVLGGVLGPFNVGPGATQGTPVPPNEPAC